MPEILLHSPIPADSPWSWQPYPDVWLLFVALLGGYFLALRHLGPRFVAFGDPTASRRQVVLFVSGVVLLWIPSDFPMHGLAEEYLYSAHMLQHMFFWLVSPPLLLMGTPRWLLRWLLSPNWIHKPAQQLMKPLPALIIFNLVVVVTHLPAVVDLTLRVGIAHLGAHVFIVGSALLMWWPVVGRLPEFPRLLAPGQISYLFAQSIVPTVPASFLTFSEHPIYGFYEGVPRLFGLSALEDQQLAGLFMKLIGGLALWGIITVLFFRWYAREEQAEREGLTWPSVERELDDMGLTQEGS